jgi:hypothetical protein
MEIFPPIWNGTLREHYLLLFSVAGSIGLVAGFAGAWLGARFASKRMTQELRENLPSADQQRLASTQLLELAQALDAVALEVERLSEGQRFTARLLAERTSPPRASEAPRAHGVITPH